MTEVEEDGNLLTWDEVLTQVPRWNGLLVGNGSSRAVWDGFAYETLFEAAHSGDTDPGINGYDAKIFSVFGTENFEVALASLRTAERVATVMKQTRRRSTCRLHIRNSGGIQDRL